MNMAEGIRRFARVVSLIGWLLLPVGLFYAWQKFQLHHEGSAVFDPFWGALIACLLLQAIAWIIKGIARPKSA
jgi:hypothetical protein